MKKNNKSKLLNVKNIIFVICPTLFQDYDILAIGDYSLLYTLVKNYAHFHLIKKSKFGGIPILILDTCDTLKDAISCLKRYNKLYLDKQDGITVHKSRIKTLDCYGIKPKGIGKISFTDPYQEEEYYQRLQRESNELRGSGAGW